MIFNIATMIDRFFLNFFVFRNMSGVSFGSTGSLRQLTSVSTPTELCDLLGGDRVINKVID
jgi:hypothetical protein